MEENWLRTDRRTDTPRSRNEWTGLLLRTCYNLTSIHYWPWFLLGRQLGTYWIYLKECLIVFWPWQRLVMLEFILTHAYFKFWYWKMRTASKILWAFLWVLSTFDWSIICNGKTDKKLQLLTWRAPIFLVQFCSKTAICIWYFSRGRKEWE